jgi:DNA transformation protein
VAGGDIRDYLCDVLASLGKIEKSRFFGLGGIKVEGQLIGFTDEEKIYFRTDADTRASYVSEGGEPFSFYKGMELIVTGYLTIPDRLLDEPEELIAWAARAREAALNAPTAVKRRQKNARTAARAASEKKAVRSKKSRAKAKPRVKTSKRKARSKKSKR